MAQSNLGKAVAALLKTQPERWAYSPLSEQHETNQFGVFASRKEAIEAAKQAGWGGVRVGQVREVVPDATLYARSSDEATIALCNSDAIKASLKDMLLAWSRENLQGAWFLAKADCTIVENLSQ